LAHATSLTPPLFIEVPVAMQARKLSGNEFVARVLILHFSTIFLLDFETASDSVVVFDFYFMTSSYCLIKQIYVVSSNLAQAMCPRYNIM
jgi:hypothetical protein